MFLTLTLVSLWGCMDKNINTNEAIEISVYEDTTSFTQVDPATTVQDASDSTLHFKTEDGSISDTIFAYLIDKEILTEEYTKNDLLSQKQFVVADDTLGIIIVSGDTTSGDSIFVPIKSILYKRTADSLCHIVIPSVNEDDFKYIFTKDSLIVFGYSSVVGYTELYLYDHQEKELMISEKFDEADQLDKSSLKTATMSFEVCNYADSILTKKLQKIDWDRCQQ